MLKICLCLGNIAFANFNLSVHPINSHLNLKIPIIAFQSFYKNPSLNLQKQSPGGVL